MRHAIYNAAAANEFDKFTLKLLTYKEELENNNTVKEHKEYYDRYFVIKDTPKRGRKIEFNNEEIQKYRNLYSGYFVLLSNATKDPIEAIEIYRNKDVVENSFDDLKNQLDMKRLRVHKSNSMDSRLFIQFLALIYICKLREKINTTKALENYTVRELLEEMDTLTRISYSGKYGSILSEISKKQRIIMDAFSLEVVT